MNIKKFAANLDSWGIPPISLSLSARVHRFLCVCVRFRLCERQLFELFILYTNCILLHAIFPVTERSYFDTWNYFPRACWLFFRSRSEKALFKRAYTCLRVNIRSPPSLCNWNIHCNSSIKLVIIHQPDAIHRRHARTSFLHVCEFLFLRATITYEHKVLYLRSSNVRFARQFFP